MALGKAGASPAALSLLYDYFSPKVRTTVIGIYAAGVSIGAGIGLFLGGAILSAWSNAWPDPSLAPFGLKGWQAAFMVVGLPGLLLALLISTLKEPVRGQAESLVAAVTANPVTTACGTSPAHPAPGNSTHGTWSQPVAVAPGRRESDMLMLNVGVGLVIVLLAFLLTQATGDVLQWLAMAIGLYCVFSWGQGLACRDPVCFGLIFHCKALRYLYLFIGLQAFSGSSGWLLDDSLVSALFRY